MADEYGPALPPGLKSKQKSDSEDENEKNESSSYGPALPPGLSSSKKVIGPVFPSQIKSSSESESDEDRRTESFGNSQNTDSEEEDLTVVGPMLVEANRDSGQASVAAEIEQRSKQMRDRLTNPSIEGPAKRDSWMTELPPEISKNFGLQNRSFRAGKGAAKSEDGDRSVWTDTPESRKEKEKKSKKRRRNDSGVTSVRDQQLQKQVDEYNETKRPKSLLEMHSKKQKKKMKKEKKKEKKEKKARKERGEKEKKPERRPFDRDNDLQVNRFDDAQRKLMIQKSQLLNTKFSKGATTSHFL